MSDDHPQRVSGDPHRPKSRQPQARGGLDKRDAKDLRNNKALLYLSIFVTLISLVAFFWLTGIADWRGSEGQYSFYINRERGCGNMKGRLRVDLSGKIATVQYFGSVDTEKSAADCKFFDIASFPPPISTTDCSTPGRQITSELYEHEQGWGKIRVPSETITVGEVEEQRKICFKLQYPRKSLLDSSGLSERGFVIQLLCMNCGLDFFPPIGFPVVESSIPADEAGLIGEWSFKIPETSGSASPPVRLKMRNDKLARVDHILDSSIAALLGVGVGGIINAYLALILLRRSHRQHSA